MMTDPIAAIMPPMRQEILVGATFEKSNAGETKLATMLMPIVAIANVSTPRTAAVVLSILSTMCTGSVTILPSASRPMTVTPAETVHTTRIEKKRKLTGRPQKLPFLTSPKVLP